MMLVEEPGSIADGIAGQDEGSSGLRGLLVRDPYASQLLDGEKSGIRRRSTHVRGPILIIKSGTGDIRVDGPNVTIENVHKLD